MKQKDCHSIIRPGSSHHLAPLKSVDTITPESIGGNLAELIFRREERGRRPHRRRHRRRVRRISARKGNVGGVRVRASRQVHKSSAGRGRGRWLPKVPLVAGISFPRRSHIF